MRIKMEKMCEKTQEMIAIGSELSKTEHDHIQSCSSCSLLFMEYQSLQLLVSSSADGEVPPGFADAVMRKIDAEPDAKDTEDAMAGIFRFFERLMEIPQAQNVALGIGGVGSIFSLVRFALFVLIPAGAGNLF
jgi:hypothetical protein